jgi:hypothetical protein
MVLIRIDPSLDSRSGIEVDACASILLLDGIGAMLEYEVR